MATPLLGILMLETRFPRPVGDIGNPATWPFPVRYGVVPEARVGRVVAGQPDPALAAPFLEVAEALLDGGVGAITTSCGFLVMFQSLLASRLPVPVLSSSLLQIPWLMPLLGGRRVGVITIDGQCLGECHLRAAGAPADTPVEGLEGGELHRVIMNDLTILDEDAARRELLTAGERLKNRVPELGAVVLECTNLAPYSEALRVHLGLPVYDIRSAVQWLWAGLGQTPPHQLPGPG